MPAGPGWHDRSPSREEIRLVDLTAALAHEDHHVRLAALKAVLDGRDANALDPIVSHLSAEHHAKVRAAIAYTLGRLGGQPQVPALARLTADESPDVRLRAAEALAAIRDPACYPALVRCVGADPDPRVRDLAAHSLVALGKDSFLGLLGQMLRSDAAWMREAAVRACPQFNTPLVVPLLVGAHAIQTGALRELAWQGLCRLADLKNAAAEAALRAIEARQATAPPPPPVDHEAHAAAHHAAQSEAMRHLDIDSTYTGGLFPRVEIDQNPFEHRPEAANQTPPAPAQQQSPLTGQSATSDPRPVGAPESAGRPAPPTPGEGLMPAAPGSARSSARAQPHVAAPSHPDTAMHPAEPSPAPTSGALPVGAAALAAHGQHGPAPAPHAQPPSGLDGGYAPPHRVGARPGEAGSAGAEDKPRTRPCPVCGEEIALAAKKCRFCHEVFDAEGLKAVEAIAEQSGPVTTLPLPLSILSALAILAFCWGEAYLVKTLGEGGPTAGANFVGMVVLGFFVVALFELRHGKAWAWWMFLVLVALSLLGNLANVNASGLGAGAVWLAALLEPRARLYCRR